MMMKREGPYRHVHLVYTYHVVIQFRVHLARRKRMRSGSSFVETRADMQPPPTPVRFTNLKVGLQRFEDQVDNLQNRYKLNTTQIVWCVRVYRGKTSSLVEFLCNIFGHNLNIHTSHKNWIGRHNCLWCLVTSEQLRSPPANIPSDSIIQDHQRFLAAGGKLKNVKHFNNCVREPFFKGIPLNHFESCKTTTLY